MVKGDGSAGERGWPRIHRSQCVPWRHQQRALKGPRGTPLGKSSCNEKNVFQEGGGDGPSEMRLEIIG